MPLTSRGARRSALLILSLLSACAASDLSSDGTERTSRFTPSGVFSDFLVGRFAARRTDLDLAAEKLEEAYRRDSGVQELAREAFLAATLAGKPDAARLAANLPANPLAQLVLADQDAKEGRWEQAQARFASLAPQGMSQVLRPLLVAWAQQGAGQTDAALATLAPLVEGTRLRGVYALHAALIADVGGQRAEAARLYRLAAQEYGPLNLRLASILASWQARQGAAAEARRTIRELAAPSSELAMAGPGLEAVMDAPAVRNALDGIAEAYLAMAATLHQQGNESAQVLARLALDMRPQFTAARVLLADLQEQARHPTAALATLAQVPESDPLIGLVRLRQANLLDQAGRAEEARQVLDALARQLPSRPEPLAQAGSMFRRKKQYGEAIAAYNGAIARLGTPTRANWPLFFERGIAEERAGQWPQAQADFEAALQLAPDQPSVLNYLAYAWTERGEKLDRAKAMLEHALQLRPNDGAIIDSLGWLLLRQGDHRGALRNLERAVELEPEDSVINAHLGDALAAVGRVREAEFQWRRALNLNPDAEDAKKLNEKLAALVAAGNKAVTPR